MRTIGLLVAVFSFIGCGEDAQQTTADVAAPVESKEPVADETNDDTAMHTLVVAGESELPVCGEDSEGRLGYVSATGSFFVCTGAAWEPIDVRGAKGETGEAGEDGANGSGGVNNRIEMTITCMGDIPASDIGYRHRISLMTSGDVFAYGSVSGLSMENGASAFYSSQSVGSLQASVLVSADYVGISNGGYWIMETDRTALVTTVTYFDIDIGGDYEDVFVQPTSDCTAIDHYP